MKIKLYFQIAFVMLFLSGVSYSQDLTAVLEAIEKYQKEMKKLIDNESVRRTKDIDSLNGKFSEISLRLNSMTNAETGDMKGQLAFMNESIVNLENEIKSMKESEKESRTDLEKAAYNINSLHALLEDLKSIIEKKKEEAEVKPVKKSSDISAPQLEVLAKIQHYYDEYNNDESTFQLQEARISAKGKANSKIGYKFQAELAGTPKMLDAAINANLHSNIDVSVGQFKVPFSTGYLVSSKALHFVNRELIKSIEPGRDLGVQFSSKIPSAKLNLIAGVFNGGSINQSDKNSYKDVVFRGIFTPVKNIDIAASYYNGKTNVESNAADVEKVGGSVSAKYNNAVFVSEYIKSTTGALKSDGFYSILGYGIKSNHSTIKEFEPIVRYEQYDNNVYSNGDSKSRVTLGLNIYFHNRYNRLQINYQINNEEINKINNNELITNFQLSF